MVCCADCGLMRPRGSPGLYSTSKRVSILIKGLAEFRRALVTPAEFGGIRGTTCASRWPNRAHIDAEKRSSLRHRLLDGSNKPEDYKCYS